MDIDDLVYLGLDDAQSPSTATIDSASTLNAYTDQVPPPAPAQPIHYDPVRESDAMTPAQAPRHVNRQESLLTNLREALNDQTRQATFTCGGTLPIFLPQGDHRVESGELTPIMEERFGGSRMMARGVGIRWGGDGEGKELTLPIVNEEEGERLSALVDECRPATFGRAGKDILDESYRRAGAMGVKHFMTDFCPYSAGIIPIIEQYLLPSISGDLRPIPSRPKIAARYNLTTSQTTQIFRAIEKCTRTTGDLVVSDDIGRFLDALDILPASAEERMEIFTRLNKSGSGFTDREELMEEAARRIAMKPPPGSKQPTPKVELGGNDENRRMLSRGIRAELYKLNVYSGPSGHFKPHVDTPRSDMQIGSLVVCLPVEFSGGALAVRHQGREVVYKWGQRDPAIRWAAFYSDCEHEVVEVDTGHRITLTYNLFLAPGTGLLSGVPKPLDAPSLPLFGHLKRLYCDKAFLPKGGYLGIHLAHSYPHTHSKLHAFVPSMLKGSDMALYETLSKLGLFFILDPITDRDLPTPGALSDLEHLSLNPSLTRKPTTFTSNLAPLKIDGDLNKHALDYTDEEIVAAESFSDLLAERSCLGSFAPDNSDDEEWIDRLPEQWGILKQQMDQRDRVMWLNGAKEREMSSAFMTYGNEAQLNIGYSSGAMIVKVPKFEWRMADG